MKRNFQQNSKLNKICANIQIPNQKSSEEDLQEDITAYVHQYTKHIYDFQDNSIPKFEEIYSVTRDLIFHYFGQGVDVS